MRDISVLGGQLYRLLRRTPVRGEGLVGEARRYMPAVLTVAYVRTVPRSRRILIFIRIVLVLG